MQQLTGSSRWHMALWVVCMHMVKNTLTLTLVQKLPRIAEIVSRVPTVPPPFQHTSGQSMTFLRVCQYIYNFSRKPFKQPTRQLTCCPTELHGRCWHEVKTQGGLECTPLEWRSSNMWHPLLPSLTFILKLRILTFIKGEESDPREQALLRFSP